METLVERLKEYLNSKSPKEIEDDWERITHIKFYDRWVDKLHSLDKDLRSNLIRKVIEKYSSQEYIDREYSLGYEPRMELFTLLQKYAEKYGENVPDEYGDFVASALLVDSKWLVKLYIGQGSEIDVYEYINTNVRY